MQLDEAVTGFQSLLSKLNQSDVEQFLLWTKDTVNDASNIKTNWDEMSSSEEETTIPGKLLSDRDMDIVDMESADWLPTHQTRGSHKVELPGPSLSQSQTRLEERQKSPGVRLLTQDSPTHRESHRSSVASSRTQRDLYHSRKRPLEANVRERESKHQITSHRDRHRSSDASSQATKDLRDRIRSNRLERSMHQDPPQNSRSSATVSFRKSKPIKCGITCCKFQGYNLRRHTMQRHLPLCLRESQLGDRKLDNQRLELLQYLKKKILGEDSSLSDLLALVNKTKAIPYKAFVSDLEVAWLTRICRHQHWKVPNYFMLLPINSPALLLHWRVLVVLLDHIPVDELLSFKRGTVSESVECEDSFEVVDCVGYEDEPATGTSVAGTQIYEAFDSLFYADRLSTTLFGQSGKAVADLITADVGYSPKNTVKVVGGIMVLSDPESYPRSLPSLNSFGSAVGVHPKKCHLLTDERFQVMLNFLRSTDTIALGVTGLDRTKPESSWDLQERTMMKLLEYSMPFRPVILHMQDKSDSHAGEVSERCLQLMKENTAPTQKVHLQSFGGTVEGVCSWLEAFPRCYFGFSWRVSSFDEYQVKAMQKIPDNRLLLETDAPFFKPSTAARASTPALLGDIGEIVSQHRGTSLENIMKLTTQNGKDLYSL